MAAASQPEGLPELIALCDRLPQARVLVVGDAMLDRFVRGKVERISPEAPIPVLSVTEESDMPGGAGNVVRNLAALGVATGFVAATGDDAAGQSLNALLAAAPRFDMADGERLKPLREARLAPIVDFKGRGTKPGEPG